MGRNGHILNAASNLMGIALLIVTGINITDEAQRTYADETATFAAVLLAVSCLLSYLSLRSDERGEGYEDWADKAFIVGVAGLLMSVLILATSHV